MWAYAQRYAMVLRHQACVVPLVLLALGLSPSAGRVLPRFARGSSSGRLGQAPERASGGSASRRTALRLGEGGHSCLVTDGDSTRRGAWGLPVVRNGNASFMVQLLLCVCGDKRQQALPSCLVRDPCTCCNTLRAHRAEEARVKNALRARQSP